MPVGILKLWHSFHSHAWRKENSSQQYTIINKPIKISQFLLWSSNKVKKIHYITVNPLMYILDKQTNITGTVNLSVHKDTGPRKAGTYLQLQRLRKSYVVIVSHLRFHLRWFKIFTLLYWMDRSILQAYLWKYLNGMEPFIHD